MEYKGINGLKTAVRNASDGIICASGVTDAQIAYACADICREKERQVLVIVPYFANIRDMQERLELFFEGKTVIAFPDEERSFFSYDAKSRVLRYQRIGALKKVLEGRSGIFVADAMAASKGMCSPESFRKMSLRLERGMSMDADIRQKLVDMGYERVSMTETQGQFSVRGEIIDVFPPGAEYPLRIDTFDIEIEDIKIYDPMTQRSLRSLKYAVITPAETAAPENAGEAVYLWDYFDEDALIIADDWQRICGQIEAAEKEYLSMVEMSEEGRLSEIEVFAPAGSMAEALEKRGAVITVPFLSRLKYFERQAALVDMNCMQALTFNGRMDMFGEELKRLRNEKYDITLVCSTDERIKNLRDFIHRISPADEPEEEEDPFRNLRSMMLGILEEETEDPAAGEAPDEGGRPRAEDDDTEDGEAGSGGGLSFVRGSLKAGMYYISDKKAVISDADIFRSGKKTRKRKRVSGERKMAVFADFKEGDYVVHENHGVGRFTGIKPMKMDGKRRDYICISYAGSDMLYVPVEHMDLVQPYIGSGGNTPKINRLSTAEWSRTKEKARIAIEHMAEDIVKLSAQRRLQHGHAFKIDSTWQKQFDDMFPYVETEDQLRSIEEIRQDMSDMWPMDRLLCGDVGFGKTEVAARAVFTCVMDGKQAAVLAPTTILADQHYHTFLKRFEKFPVTIELVNRFRSEAEQKKALKGLAEGSVDIIIGTHRLLSDDVRFSDLGLLVIDEEQRFGVQHKEKLKMMKQNVDVLSISATPIPRTLHMSMSGIRSLSTLQEPPEERYPVQTFVMEQDDALIREVILREINRGGQVFVVYNRVKGINIIADRIRQLVPEAEVASVHGRMNERKLEDVMSDFINGEYDVLVATTIIESGIDIKTANTLIVLDSDRYGLAQLYQLRGRVGRSDVPAYAYLMYQKDKILTDVALKRLKAVMQFTEFGSGFRVAMKDLEIRGAGNLIGTEQSGHMMNIGYELYCKMVDDAVRRLKGEAVPEIGQEVTIDIRADAFISSEYIPDESVKLDMYKRISGIADEKDMEDVSDELIDRFGDIPPETVSLMKVARLKSSAEKAGIIRVSRMDDSVRIDFSPSAPLKPENFLRLSSRYRNRIYISTGKTPFIKMRISNKNKVLDEVQDLLDIFNAGKQGGMKTAAGKGKSAAQDKKV